MQTAQDSRARSGSTPAGPVRVATDTEREARNEISGSADCGRNRSGLSCVQTLFAEIPLLRRNDQENPSLLLRPGSPRWGARPASFLVRPVSCW